MRSHSFNKQGIQSFTEHALSEAMENNAHLTLTIGSHTIRVPMFSETYESMEGLLMETLKIIVSEGLEVSE